jgi:hypothetical protein
MECVRSPVAQRSYQHSAPQSVRSKGDWQCSHTACLLQKGVKYAEIEVEGDGEEQKLEEKGDGKTGKK